jgi:hypothetical protein
LGEVSPFGWLFTLSSFCENYRRSANNWANFFNNKSNHRAITKVDWATGWATFSIARLVTLSMTLCDAMSVNHAGLTASYA